jgi:YidC/Oxa1 family membrane protein insertase
MDKNSIYGFGLMVVLLMGYLYFNQKTADSLKAKKTSDSIATAKALPPQKAPVLAADSNKIIDTTINAEQVYTLANTDMSITFSNKGATPVEVKLLHFTTATPISNRQALKVFTKGQHSLSYTLGNNTTTKNTIYTATQAGNTLTFTAAGLPTITYTLPPSGYITNMAISNNNASSPATLVWTGIGPNTEYEAKNESQYNQIVYNETEDGVDYNTLTDVKEQEFTKGASWLSFKQHYFNTTIIASNAAFTKGKVKAQPTNDASGKTLTSINAQLTLPAEATVNMQLYTGPNDYKILKSLGKDLQEIIPLGYGFLSFVKYINKWMIMPIFNFLSGLGLGWGIVIMLLTLIVRLLMAPITYKSYVSGAKMKVLKPDIDALREKYGDNQQEMSMKQMELYRSTGVNPLSGCLPALAQLPIFFALLSFFPNAIQLRQQSFLWTKDFSTFDSILNIPNIPFYGDHISLWTLLFVATQLFLAVYSMNMGSVDQSNPAMKYLPFIMPVMFLGIFNSLPASLTFYYFISNLITIILQIVIQKVIIKEDKIRAQIEQNKKSGPKQSKFMERMMEMQKQNQERVKNQASNKK